MTNPHRALSGLISSASGLCRTNRPVLQRDPATRPSVRASPKRTDVYCFHERRHRPGSYVAPAGVPSQAAVRPRLWRRTRLPSSRAAKTGKSNSTEKN